MVVQGLSSYRHYQLKPQREKNGVATGSSTPQKVSQGKGAKAESSDRSEFLKLVRQKIRKGHYNSDAVLDDLSHSFAGAFDKIL
jgi:hypothetical protein